MQLHCTARRGAAQPNVPRLNCPAQLPSGWLRGRTSPIPDPDTDPATDPATNTNTATGIAEAAPTRSIPVFLAPRGAETLLCRAADGHSRGSEKQKATDRLHVTPTLQSLAQLQATLVPRPWLPSASSLPATRSAFLGQKFPFALDEPNRSDTCRRVGVPVPHTPRTVKAKAMHATTSPASTAAAATEQEPQKDAAVADKNSQVLGLSALPLCMPRSPA
ncbi:uncharacterized protein UV8b_06705 [Ustilaginoidea virens]|uniref:Uncharacterized protein n=1 Tax=Ustilaginoidea virens TaxID=1159556 RepID=A0A8E5HVQ7_USTVR|nr:uncharacterized protein UV8b_06705 [Ustilaginoidea virens]QUC22464.1 hypothetical protein UV8b_06705 [Ustilaginoidea virens]